MRNLGPGVRLPGAPPDSVNEAVVPEDRPQPLGQLGAVAARWNHRRSRRSCHDRAISSGHERYPVDPSLRTAHPPFDRSGRGSASPRIIVSSRSSRCAISLKRASIRLSSASSPWVS